MTITRPVVHPSVIENILLFLHIFKSGQGNIGRVYQWLFKYMEVMGLIYIIWFNYWHWWPNITLNRFCSFFLYIFAVVYIYTNMQCLSSSSQLLLRASYICSTTLCSWLPSMRPILYTMYLKKVKFNHIHKSRWHYWVRVSKLINDELPGFPSVCV